MSKSKKRVVYGRGINDSTEPVTYCENGKRKKIKSYVTWVSMLRRCYSAKYHKKHPTYIGCSVCKEWLSFLNFKKWYENNYPLYLDESLKLSLDKDLLSEGNKIYSPERCVFLPNKINSFIANSKSNNKSGFIGVAFNKLKNKYIATIKDFTIKKNKHLGYF